MERQLPKVLILSRSVWDDKDGTSSTLTNLFKDYDPDKLAQIYIETIEPNTACCHRFFQISEFSLVHKLYKWRTKTGRVIDTHQIDSKASRNGKIAEQEAATMNYVRSHRSIWFSIAREFLWLFKGWKTEELKQFIMDFKPDVIWINGATLPFLNNLYNYVLQTAQAHPVIYMQDDNYSYHTKKLIGRLYKWYHRKTIKRIVNQCDRVFVISPKMKREYDEVFKINSILLTKGIDVNNIPVPKPIIHKPIKLVYLGQIIYGRIYSLLAIADALKELNQGDTIAQLYIYTINTIPSDIKEHLSKNDSTFIMPPVKYDEVQQVISKNDVVVFVESFDPAYCRTARLSFSTKITDYLSSGKCIFAVGPKDIAPIEYFIENDAAIVASTQEEIKEKILGLSDSSLVGSYAIKARKCAINNHNKELMTQKLFEELSSLSSGNSN